LSSLEQQLAELKSRKQQKELERARVEAQADAARDQVREATKLLMEMGCSTIEEARKQMATLRKSIDDKIEEIRRSL
jgi:hypothetical protein